ncbi:MAG: hypothetical protein HQK49_15470 [Oligoflexia bacterium]|nr:hypothetical protein [Oligoflexia bacterium]
MVENYIKNIEDIENNNINSNEKLQGSLELLGGKAHNLYHLSKIEGDILVPPWFCINSKCFKDIIAPISDEIKNIINKIDYDSSESLLSSCKQIQQMIYTQKIPDNLEEQLVKYLKKNIHDNNHAFRGKNQLFAVRSSCNVEDGSEKSFAGMFESFLFVKEDQLLENIKRCWCSTYNINVLKYMQHHQIDPMKNRMAVIVQSMVDAVASGVLFQSDPTSSISAQGLIVASYGVGEGVVKGQVEHDTYFFNRKTQVVNKSIINKKLKKISFNHKNGTGTIDQEVDEVNGRAAVLSKDEISLLIKISNSIYNHFNILQDIEWCIDRERNIFITQTRAITIVFNKTKINDNKKVVFDNSNIVESYAGVVSPLTFSLLKDGYSLNFSNSLVKVGFSEKKVIDSQKYLNNLVAYLEGRVFYNLNNWHRTLALFPYAEKKLQPLFDDMIGVSSKVKSKSGDDKDNSNNMEKTYANFVAKIIASIYFYFLLIIKMLFLDLLMLKYKKAFTAIYIKYKRQNLNNLTLNELADEFTSFSRNIISIFYYPLLNDLRAIVAMGVLKYLCKRWRIVDDESAEIILNDLLCGIKGMESAEIIYSLVELAEIVRKDQQLKKTIKDVCSQQKEIDFTLFPIFNQKFGHYLEKFADRSIQELKLEVSTFREDPYKALILILTYSEDDINVVEMRNRETTIRANAEKKLSIQLKYSPIKKIIFSISKFFTKVSLVQRESARIDRARFFGVVREIFNNIGKRLYELKVLKDPRDIFYLTYYEVIEYINSSSINLNLNKLVEIRKINECEYLKKSPPGRIISKGSYYLEIKENHVSKINLFNEGQNNICSWKLQGVPVSPGLIEANALVINDPLEITKNCNEYFSIKNKILVTEMTDPGWVFLMMLSSGIISEKGSVLSHTAIIGRELGIPTIVGVDDATKIIKSGDLLRMNGNTGIIEFAKGQGISLGQ